MKLPKNIINGLSTCASAFSWLSCSVGNHSVLFTWFQWHYDELLGINYYTRGSLLQYVVTLVGPRHYEIVMLSQVV